jgi:hypothetical protein
MAILTILTIDFEIILKKNLERRKKCMDTLFYL